MTPAQIELLSKAQRRNQAAEAELMLDTLLAGGACGPFKSPETFIGKFRKALKEIQQS